MTVSSLPDRFRRRRRIFLLELTCGATLLLGLFSAAWGRDRLHRRYDGTNGLPVSYVHNVEQDARGFLWIGTEAGLVRYDGVTMQRWSNDNAIVVPGIRYADDVFVVAVADREQRRLHRAVEGGLEPVAGADRFQAVGYAVSDDGAVWLSDHDRIVRRSREGRWSDVPFPSAVASGELHLLRPGRDGSVLCGDRRTLVRLRPLGEVQVLAPLRRVVSALERPDGSVLALSWADQTAHLHEVRDGWASEIWSRAGDRAISIVERGSTIWIALDIGLVAIRPGEAPEPVTYADGQPGGGHLFVDHEGSLWAASWRGLVQYPEPGTAAWPAAPHVLRYLTRSPEAVWTVGWGELQRTKFEDGAWTTRLVHPEHGAATTCIDARGSVWTSRGNAFLEYAPDGTEVEHPRDVTLHLLPCSSTNDGGLWMPTATGVYRLDPGATTPHRPTQAPPAPDGEVAVDSVTEDGRGNLWTTRGERVCHAPLVRGTPVPPWSCETIDGAEFVRTGFRLSSDAFWVVTMKAGIFRVRGDALERIPASLELPTRWIEMPALSPRGGVWIPGNGFCVRVLDRPDLPAGWEVVERLSFRNGLPSLSVVAIAEDADGTLWLATDAGLVQVPPSAREDHSAPPESVAIVEAAVDGTRVPTTGPIALPYHRNRLELRFAPVSFLDPASVRYRVRLRPEDPWSDPIAEPFFRYVDVAPGRYAIEVAATLDGERWSPRPARVEFAVGRPWYSQGWFVGLSVAALVLCAWVVHRVRLRGALRVERERMRIAMDLHDGMGSGLGSIGILASLAAAEGGDEEERRGIAREIAAAAGELGHGLTDLVASLRPGSATLGALGRHLVERGRRMFPGGTAELVVELPPTADDVPVSLPVRRNVLLVGLEALHNVAKHSGARRVVLRIEPAGRRWRLHVEDDGQGLPPASEARLLGGVGVESMRRRAEEIGADLVIAPREGGGTVVSLAFDPRTKDQGPLSPRALA